MKQFLHISPKVIPSLSFNSYLGHDLPATLMFISVPCAFLRVLLQLFLISSLYWVLLWNSSTVSSIVKQKVSLPKIILQLLAFSFHLFTIFSKLWVLNLSETDSCQWCEGRLQFHFSHIKLLTLLHILAFFFSQKFFMLLIAYIKYHMHIVFYFVTLVNNLSLFYS